MSSLDKTTADTEAADAALSDEELATVAPEVLANSLGEYAKAWLNRVKNGESGAVPVIVGLIAIVIFFQLEKSQFLTGANLVNLLVQSSIYIMFAAGQTYVLLLSEIDLSAGYMAGVGAFVTAEMIASPVHMVWWLGIICGVLATSFLGLVQGLLVAGLGLPSFIVTLGGYLGFQGLMQEVANADSSANGGTLNIDPSSPVAKLATGHMSTTLGWIVMVVAVAAFAAITLYSHRSRIAQGLTAPPIGVQFLKIAAAAVAGVVLMIICESNQGSAILAIRGVPWVIPFVLVVLLVYSFFLSRTRTGRYIYAVGNSPEAARRAGIKVKWILTLGFILSGLTAGFAGLIYESQQGGIGIDMPGGQLVLFAVAAAVIGGTSLFGGRGRIVNALLGGIVIGAVFNGLGLMGVSNAIQDMVTAVVLIAAVSLDALVRRRSTVRR